MGQEFVTNAFEPIFDQTSRILILGTIPSPKSRENGFYYSHPQNRFWRVMAGLFNQERPCTVGEKQQFLMKQHIALWDVLYSCEISGADDSSIRSPIPNDIGKLLTVAPICTIFTTGNKASALYKKYCYPLTKIEAIPLPSTSPANAKMNLMTLIEEYRIILKHLDDS